jgi:DNA recombination protein RmuC
MTDILLIILVILVLANIVLMLLRRRPAKDPAIDKLLNDVARIEPAVRDEFRMNREETGKSFRETREELSASFKTLGDNVTGTLRSNEEKTDKLTRSMDDKVNTLQTNLTSALAESRAELAKSLQSFEQKFTDSVKDFNELQRQKFSDLAAKQDELNRSTESRLKEMRETIEQKLRTIQEENAVKLEEMRKTVDEKLHETLEKRLSESFRQVSERLEQVHKGLGEMQNLATGVGDLKKVLSNVKTRGVLGEIQLGNILESILSAEQYATNVATKKGSRENVEYAIKLPGKDEEGHIVYLPIDSKFPVEAYHALLDAYEKGNPEEVRSFTRAVESEIRRCARDIRDKYINPPETTDFGILFLPFEGLYAEVVRQTSLIEVLQREYKIIVTGPTTLAALLNSLQMGFRTLAIEKRSSEVWRILGAVKTEFGKFGDVLRKAQDKILKAGEDIDELVGIRTRKIQSRLKSIEILPEGESPLLLEPKTDENDEEPTG